MTSEQERNIEQVIADIKTYHFGPVAQEVANKLTEHPVVIARGSCGIGKTRFFVPALEAVLKAGNRHVTYRICPNDTGWIQGMTNVEDKFSSVLILDEAGGGAEDRTLLERIDLFRNYVDRALEKYAGLVPVIVYWYSSKDIVHAHEEWQEAVDRTLGYKPEVIEIPRELPSALALDYLRAFHPRKKPDSPAVEEIFSYIINNVPAVLWILDALSFEVACCTRSDPGRLSIKDLSEDFILILKGVALGCLTNDEYSTIIRKLRSHQDRVIRSC